MVEVATGTVLDRLVPEFHPGYGGAWTDDGLALPTLDGFAQLTWDGALSVSQVVSLALDSPHEVYPPLVLADGMLSFRVAVESPRFSYLAVSCSLAAEQCVASPPMDGPNAAPVANPSSPRG